MESLAWKQHWIYGDAVILRQWLEENYPGEDGYSLPANVSFKPAYYCAPMEQVGTDSETGLPTYAQIEGRTDFVWLVCTRGEGEQLLAEAEALEAVYAVYDDMETLKAELPEHCICAIPHLASS